MENQLFIDEWSHVFPFEPHENEPFPASHVWRFRRVAPYFHPYKHRSWVKNSAPNHLEGVQESLVIQGVVLVEHCVVHLNSEKWFI